MSPRERPENSRDEPLDAPSRGSDERGDIVAVIDQVMDEVTAEQSGGSSYEMPHSASNGLENSRIAELEPSSLLSWCDDRYFYAVTRRIWVTRFRVEVRIAATMRHRLQYRPTLTSASNEPIQPVNLNTVGFGPDIASNGQKV